MIDIQTFKRGDKTWLRNFANQNNITFKEMHTKIFPHTSKKTLEKLWQGVHAANGIYADALIWYAQAKNLEWNGVVSK